jgi:hypothetical protein
MRVGMGFLTGLPTRAPADLSVSASRGPASPGHRPRLVGHPAGVAEVLAEQHFDLRVQAAELVGGPAGKGVVDGGVDAQQELFALTALTGHV